MKAPILFSMPEANRPLNYLERKAPRLRVNFGVNHQTIGGGTPGLALTFEASLEGGDVAHYIGTAGLQQFEKKRTNPHWNFQGKKRTYGVKREAQQFAMSWIKKEEPAIER